MGDYCVQMPLLYSLKQNIRSGNIQFVMVFNIRNVCRKLWIFPSTNGSRTEKHNICYRLLLTSSHVPVFALFIAISFSPPAIIRFLSLHSYGPMIFFLLLSRDILLFSLFSHIKTCLSVYSR